MKRSARRSRSTERAAAYNDAYERTRRAVEQFAKTHPHLDELAKPILFWLGKGLDLDDAYLVADTLSRRQAIRRAVRRRT